jgi:hypothetical protein
LNVKEADPKREPSDPNALDRVYIPSLPEDVSKMDIETYFSQFGDVSTRLYSLLPSRPV